MAKPFSLKELMSKPSWFEGPLPLELVGDTSILEAELLYQHGIPTPVSGDPLEQNLGEN